MKASLYFLMLLTVAFVVTVAANITIDAVERQIKEGAVEW